MTTKNVAVIIRRILFIALVAILILQLFLIFERKTLDNEWNYTLKVGGFANEPENSVEVVGVGSSHMYCTLDPVHVYETTGVSSYVLATQQQPVEATYYYVKEALLQQSPKVVIIEAFMYASETETATEGVAHDAYDPFPAGLNKLNMILETDAEGEKVNYLLSFLKYHTRWKELGREDYERDYENETDPFHGYVFLTRAKANTCRALSYEGISAEPLSKKNFEYLQKTVELVLESGSQPVILVAPYNSAENDLGKYKFISSYCEENNVAFLDMNLWLDDMGIDNETDFYDGGHFNASGAEKASSFLFDFITERVSLAEDTENDALWQKDIAYYHEQKQKAE